MCDHATRLKPREKSKNPNPWKNVQYMCIYAQYIILPTTVGICATSLSPFHSLSDLLFDHTVKSLN